MSFAKITASPRSTPSAQGWGAGGAPTSAGVEGDVDGSMPGRPLGAGAAVAQHVVHLPAPVRVDAHDLVAGGRVAVPAPVEGDERVPLPSAGESAGAFIGNLTQQGSDAQMRPLIVSAHLTEAVMSIRSLAC